MGRLVEMQYRGLLSTGVFDLAYPLRIAAKFALLFVQAFARESAGTGRNECLTRRDWVRFLVRVFSALIALGMDSGLDLAPSPFEEPLLDGKVLFGFDLIAEVE